MCKIGLLLPKLFSLISPNRSSLGRIGCELLSKSKDANSILRSCCRFLWPLYLLISCNSMVRVGFNEKSAFILKNAFKL